MYKIIGVDGREYGPATAGQLRQWIAEGRANAQTPTLAPGAPEGNPLGAAGICGTFRAANSAGDRAAEAGDFNGGPIAQNQFLCNGRTDFRHFVADGLLRMSVQHSRARLFLF